MDTIALEECETDIDCKNKYDNLAVCGDPSQNFNCICVNSLTGNTYIPVNPDTQTSPNLPKIPPQNPPPQNKCDKKKGDECAGNADCNQAQGETCVSCACTKTSCTSGDECRSDSDCVISGETCTGAPACDCVKTSCTDSDECRSDSDCLLGQTCSGLPNCECQPTGQTANPCDEFPAIPGCQPMVGKECGKGGLVGPQGPYTLHCNSDCSCTP